MVSNPHVVNTKISHAGWGNGNLNTSGAAPTNGASHYNDVIISAIASQITSLTIVYSTVYSGAEQRKHHSSASLAFVPGIHRWPVNSPHKGPITRIMFPFDDVIMNLVITVFADVLTPNVTRPSASAVLTSKLDIYSFKIALRMIYIPMWRDFIYLWFTFSLRWLGGRLSIKMSSYRYRDPHVKDKTVSRPSYF